ncbi:prolyl oligopeptidase family serine peptidase [Actinomadura barringtoniae]|uniref:Prolyl oligopeptidase family serine peptidase n=1 Tax=Actinomadura barringtoniae TaxID=1427535 RepID=A0A939PT09_9ACTN|nr:prolyl oligopeptidase family serine peptidase [Actinomadura barringtoniae]MBO2454549.1 prolyl oligopeptidase family serine peptidase [Actinomadura barringtoniae]
MSIDIATPELTPPRRRSLSRVAVAAVLALVVLLAAATAGIGWYFSGVAVEVTHADVYDLKILDSGDGTVTLPRDETTALPGTWALVWKTDRDKAPKNDRALLGPVVTATSKKVVRKLETNGVAAPAKGAKAFIDHWIYDSDPRQALGVDFQNVTYPSELGPMPAWLIPGRTFNGPWVIGVHGRNADKLETMRAIPTVHRLGLPMLSIAYRNDSNAPVSRDGKNHLGDTEWKDVASAIVYARAHGATGIILHGWSMGGAMVMTTLRKDPAFIRGVVLDSPVMDWNATLDKQGASRHLPGFVTDVAKQILERRIGIKLADFDQRPYAPQIKVPVLLYTTADDETVDNGPAFTFARKAPHGLVTHVETQGGHTEAWNVNPSAYETALTTFLTKIH